MGTICTKRLVFVLIPKHEVFLDRLVLMKSYRMPYTLGQLIGCRENMFATFTLHISSAFDVQWMPVQLAHVVVRMSMKGTHHEAQMVPLYPWTNATGTCIAKAQPMSYAQPPLGPYTNSRQSTIASGYLALTGCQNYQV